eukprot:1155215-Pelagomonas_calceolata.AAC.7
MALLTRGGLLCSAEEFTLICSAYRHLSTHLDMHKVSTCLHFPHNFTFFHNVTLQPDSAQESHPTAPPCSISCCCCCCWKVTLGEWRRGSWAGRLESKLRSVSPLTECPPPAAALATPAGLPSSLLRLVGFEVTSRRGSEKSEDWAVKWGSAGWTVGREKDTVVRQVMYTQALFKKAKKFSMYLFAACGSLIWMIREARRSNASGHSNNASQCAQSPGFYLQYLHLHSKIEKSLFRLFGLAM